ncbi:unnamed protein product, partial [Callosobruchus maculatus]
FRSVLRTQLTTTRRCEVRAAFAEICLETECVCRNRTEICFRPDRRRIFGNLYFTKTMTNHANSEEFIRNFIEIYYRHPALWKIKSRSYSDRKLKEAGYNELIELYKTVDSSANAETVKKKINNLRSAFRKEHKKVKRSTSSNVYKPTLWYYDLLMFTVGQREAREEQSDEDSDFGDGINTQIEEDVVAEAVYSPTEFTLTLPTTPSSRPASRISEAPIVNRVKKQKVDTKNKEDMLYKIITKLDNEEDEFDVTGKHIGNKLRHLSRDQRIHAEKIIMDVLYEAELGTLNRGSKLQVNQERINLA